MTGGKYVRQQRPRTDLHGIYCIQYRALTLCEFRGNSACSNAVFQLLAWVSRGGQGRLAEWIGCISHMPALGKLLPHCTLGIGSCARATAQGASSAIRVTGVIALLAGYRRRKTERCV